jgi:hypothetical protein
MVREGFDAPDAPRERDATGERQRLPCQDGVYNTHILQYGLTSAFSIHGMNRNDTIMKQLMIRL